MNKRRGNGYGRVSGIAHEKCSNRDQNELDRDGHIVLQAAELARVGLTRLRTTRTRTDNQAMRNLLCSFLKLSCGLENRGTHLRKVSLAWFGDHAEVAKLVTNSALGLVAAHREREEVVRVGEPTRSKRLSKDQRHCLLSGVRREPSEFVVRSLCHRDPLLDSHGMQVMQQVLRFKRQVTPVVQDEATLRVRIYCVLKFSIGVSAHSKLKTIVAFDRSGMLRSCMMCSYNNLCVFLTSRV